jgi:MFS family permease
MDTTSSRTTTGARAARRPLAALFAGVAFLQTAMSGASTAATLVAAAAVGAAWSGAPNTAGVLGTSAGALLLAARMAARGRRAGLLAGYAAGTIGALLAVLSALTAWLPVLLAGMLLLGVGNAAAGLARYAAADLYPPSRQGFAVGLVVWAGTVGGVLGPSLLAPTAGVAAGLGLAPLAGPFLLALAVTALAFVTTLGLPRLARAAAGPATLEGPPAPDGRRAAGEAGAGEVRLALVAMVAAQVAMVAVMTMTPLHIQHAGGHLRTVGLVLSSHVLGMFALSPLSGRIVDRYGARAAIVLGALVLAGSTVAPVLFTSSLGGVGLSVVLFALGYGWNLSLVGGSAVLGQVAAARRARLQGVGDSLAWGASAVASLSSGAIFAAGGYPLLAAVGGAVALVPLGLLTLGRADVVGGRRGT